MPPKICFVIPYFGTWPFWFPFFLESCRSNPDINWILYSDCTTDERIPENVKIINTQYAAYCEMVSESLKISFRPSSPYKLCYLKPALGYIYREDLVDYDFLAFGDIDPAYGNLRAYFTEKRLSRNDIFSTHLRRASGHCCLLRNTSFTREAFTHVPDWKILLETPQHQWFDESAFSRLFIKHKNWPAALAKAAKPLSRWTICINNEEAFSTPYAKLPWIDGSYNFPNEWRWDSGRLTNDRFFHDFSSNACFLVNA